MHLLLTNQVELGRVVDVDEHTLRHACLVQRKVDQRDLRFVDATRHGLRDGNAVECVTFNVLRLFGAAAVRLQNIDVFNVVFGFAARSHGLNSLSSLYVNINKYIASIITNLRVRFDEF